jgi:Tol biopolymer transport system component
MPTSYKPTLKGLALITVILLAACRTGPAPTVTPAPSVTAPPSATPVAVTPVAGPGFLLAAPDKSVVFVGLDGQPRPLSAAAETRYVAADLSNDSRGTLGAYAIGPQGVQPLAFVESISQGFAAYQPANGAGFLAWDNWASNADTGQVDSQIFTSALDGSQAHPALKDSAERALRVLRWSADGQRLFFSREPLGLGGYILFGGFSNLWAMNLADGAAREIVPDSAAGAICLDDISPDETQVAHHCSQKSISVLSPAGGGVTTILPPPEAVEFGQLGDARFSPDGSRVAFALARGTPDAEQGWVAVSQGMSGPARLAATSPADDYFSVWDWLDDQTLILQSHGATPGVWLVGADGTALRRVADGTLLGVVGR